MRRKLTTPKPFGTSDAVLSSLGRVASSFSEFKPAPEVLTSIQSVPTIFPQYDYVTRVKGHPISRFCLVHGPSNEGKSSFVLGLGKSFLMRNHFFAFADAERTTPKEWVDDMLGEYANHPGFVALPVSSYEQTVEGVQDFCEKVAKARDDGDIPDDTSGIIVVDSIRKLVPKKLLAKLMKEGAEKAGVDGFGGRAAQIKAALNSAWVDQLIPLLADTRMAMVVIARETEDPSAGFFEDPIKVGGGKALNYDASLRVRISRTFIKEGGEEKGAILGERHCLEIRKTKVGRKDTKYPRAYFHTSNGKLSPPGFDLARDLLELGLQTGILQKRGSWIDWDGNRIANGENAFVRRLSSEPAVLARLDEEVRSVALAADIKEE